MSPANNDDMCLLAPDTTYSSLIKLGVHVVDYTTTINITTTTTAERRGDGRVARGDRDDSRRCERLRFERKSRIPPAATKRFLFF